MNIIDTDSHSDPRPEDYVIEREYAHLRPIAFVDAKGVKHVRFNNTVLRMLASGEQGKKYENGIPHESNYYNGSLRFEEVQAAGIDYQLVSASNPTDFQYVDAKVGAAFCRAYNDFIFHCFVEPYPTTFGIIPQLPLQDIAEAIREAERCVKHLGARTLFMPTNWNGIDMAEPYWWNFWESVNELGITAISIHNQSVAAHSKWVGKERLSVLGPDGTRARRILSQPFEHGVHIINLMFGGMMDRFANLKFAFQEAGAEFAIVIKNRIEDNVRVLPYLREKLTHPVSWYFDRFYFPVDDVLLEEDGEGLVRAIKKLGPDRLLLATDYPHHKGSLDVVESIKALKTITPDVRQKILGGNAIQFLGKPLL